MLTTSARRYTSLSNAIATLRSCRLALLNPQSWDDKNDAHFLLRYKEKVGAETVLAACFSRAPETYHHWNIFAGREGVCLEIEREPLEQAVAAMPGCRSSDVEYLTIKKLRERGRLRARDLPFLKRQGYKPEAEFRIVYTSGVPTTTASVSIELSWIRRVVLSPWLHESLVAPLKATIKALPSCRQLRIYRSSLISNEQWMAAGDNARIGSR
jgi:hypothetical protein